jgi:predicted Zn-dependent protease
LDLDPNSPAVLHSSAAALAYSGRPEEAIPLLQKVIRLNPFAPATFFDTLGVVYRMVGRFDEGLDRFTLKRIHEKGIPSELPEDAK